jgi:hypothetical protein
MAKKKKIKAVKKCVKKCSKKCSREKVCGEPQQVKPSVESYSPPQISAPDSLWEKFLKLIRYSP